MPCRAEQSVAGDSYRIPNRIDGSQDKVQFEVVNPVCGQDFSSGLEVDINRRDKSKPLIFNIR